MSLSPQMEPHLLVKDMNPDYIMFQIELIWKSWTEGNTMPVFAVFNEYSRDYCPQTSWLRFVMCLQMCLGTDALNNDMSHYATRHVALKLMYLGARYVGRSLVNSCTYFGPYTCRLLSGPTRF